MDCSSPACGVKRRSWFFASRSTCSGASRQRDRPSTTPIVCCLSGNDLDRDVLTSISRILRGCGKTRRFGIRLLHDPLKLNGRVPRPSEFAVFETAVIPVVQSDDHHVQANLPAAKTTTHTIRNRNIETAKLACFLNSLRPSLIRVVRRKNTERTKRKIGIAAARKAMILKIIIHSQCRVTRSLDHLVGAGKQHRGHFRRCISMTPSPRTMRSIAGRSRASQQKRLAYVRFGSIATNRHDRDARPMSASPPILSVFIRRIP